LLLVLALRIRLALLALLIGARRLLATLSLLLLIALLFAILLLALLGTALLVLLIAHGSQSPFGMARSGVTHARCEWVSRSHASANGVFFIRDRRRFAGHQRSRGRLSRHTTHRVLTSSVGKTPQLQPW
jgi:hypothetical protein